MPLDKQTILASVAKTGRLVTVDMAHKTCSAASEIAALVAMEGFWSLQPPFSVSARPMSISLQQPWSLWCIPRRRPSPRR